MMGVAGGVADEVREGRGVWVRFGEFGEFGEMEGGRVRWGRGGRGEGRGKRAATFTM